MEKIILFQGDSITDAGRVKEPGKEANKGYGYANMVAGELMANGLVIISAMLCRARCW